MVLSGTFFQTLLEKTTSHLTNLTNLFGKALKHQLDKKWLKHVETKVGPRSQELISDDFGAFDVIQQIMRSRPSPPPGLFFQFLAYFVKKGFHMHQAIVIIGL